MIDNIDNIQFYKGFQKIKHSSSLQFLHISRGFSHQTSYVIKLNTLKGLHYSFNQFWLCLKTIMICVIWSERSASKLCCDCLMYPRTNIRVYLYISILCECQFFLHVTLCIKGMYILNWRINGKVTFMY